MIPDFPVGGITCCLGAAALYLLGRSFAWDADDLKSVTKVNQLKDLAPLLDGASKALPLVVTVSGRVGSDTPIKCEYSGLLGVIVEQTAEQHFLERNIAGSWIKNSALMLSTCKEVPWMMVVVVFEVFEESGRDQEGLMMLGLKRIERLLSTGTPLTVVGEAVKDDMGFVRIQQPHKGPFYVSDETIDQLIANLGDWSRLCKCAAVCFTAFGIYLLAKYAVQYILERRRHWEMRKDGPLRVLAKKAGNAAIKFCSWFAGLNVKAENVSDNTNKDHLCVICMEQEYNSAFVPCGHNCCCMTCSSHLTICPLCRRRIEQVVRLFRP